MPPNSLWIGLAAAGGAAYPFLVYFGLSTLPPQALVLVGLGLIALRLLGMRRLAQSRAWLLAFGLAGGGMVGLLALSPTLAVKGYPIAISLAVAAVFALSLRFPPTVIERIARLSEPNLPPQGIAYTRKVTVVWVVFLFINAAISATTALWGSLPQWTLWNGLLSYLAMGALFGVEFLVRCRMRRRATA